MRDAYYEMGDGIKTRDIRDGRGAAYCGSGDENYFQKHTRTLHPSFSEVYLL